MPLPSTSSGRNFLILLTLFVHFVSGPKFINIHQWREMDVATEDVLLYPVERLAQSTEYLLVGWDTKHSVKFFEGEFFCFREDQKDYKALVTRNAT